MSHQEETANAKTGSRALPRTGAGDEHDGARANDLRRWPLASRVVRVAGLSLLLIPTVLRDVWPAGLLRQEALGAVTVVVGDWVPSLRGPAGWCVALGLLFVVLAPALGSWGTGRRSVIAMRILSPIILTVMVALSLSSYFGVRAAQESYRVLEQSSPQGCRVLMATHSAGFQGLSYSYGLIRPGAENVEWVIRQAYSEEGDNTIEVRWERDVGRLSSSDPAQITPQLAPIRFDCRS